MICWLHTNPNKFANALGYGRTQTIYDILNGKSAPSFDFFNRFLKSGYSIFINLRWLITGEGSPIIEETYFASDLPIIKGEMTAEQAAQKLKEIKAHKAALYSQAEELAEERAQAPSNDLLKHLEKQISEKDQEIWKGREEIGRLKARIEQLKREMDEVRDFPPRGTRPQYCRVCLPNGTAKHLTIPLRATGPFLICLN